MDRAQVVCGETHLYIVHRHIEFGYHHARRTRGAWEAYEEARGVCRDIAHLVIALCSCMNVPTGHCTGYLGDVGNEPTYRRL